MKKTLVLIFFICVFLCFDVSAESIEVSVPECQIEVDEQKLENRLLEYPFLEYKNILYFPLSYNMCSLVGLETHFAKKGYSMNSPYLFYVGKGIKSMETDKENLLGINVYVKWVYKADIVEYDVYIQHEKYKNDTYPILNFRGVTYIPLIWDVAVTFLDWEYSFDGTICEINTEKAVRPKINYLAFWNTSPHRGISCDYVYGKNFYIQYPCTTYGGIEDFVYNDGEKEIRFNLGEELRSIGITSLGSQKDPGLYNSNNYVKHIPIFDGKNFVLICRAGEEHILIKVDMIQGKLIYSEKI